MIEDISRREFLKRLGKCAGIAAAADPLITAVSALDNAFSGGIYKWRDEQGNLHFSDTPVNSQQEYEQLNPDDLVRTKSIPSAANTGYLQPSQEDNAQTSNKEQEKEKPKLPQSKYHTKGHKLFDLQAEIKRNERDYTLLDNIIDDARSEVNPGRMRDTKSIKHELSKIGRVIKGYYRSGMNFETRGIKTDDCEQSLVYCSVGEVMGIPIALVDVPQHVFIRYHLAGNRAMNWETTNFSSMPDSFYIQSKGITERQLRDTSVMKSLMGEALTAYVYQASTIAMYRAGKYGKAREYCNTALSIVPNLHDLLIWKSRQG